MLNRSKSSTSGYTSSRVFWMYFISYVIVIILPILGVGFFTYTLASRMLEEEIGQAAVHNLRQKSATVEQFVQEIQSIGVRIGLDGRIYSYSKSSDNLFLLNDLKDSLKSISGSNDAIQSIEIYFNASNQIISSDGYNRSYNGLAKDVWIQDAAKQKNMSFWMNSRTVMSSDIDNIVSFVLKIPVGMKEQVGLLAVHIHEKKLRNILQSLEGNPNTSTFIVNERDELITHHSVNESVLNKPVSLQQPGPEGEGYSIQKKGSQPSMFTYISPLKNNWRIVSDTSLQYLYERLNYIRNVTFAVCGVLILIGITISYLISRRMYHPIHSLIKMTSQYRGPESAGMESPGKSDEFSIISRVLENVFRSNQDWEKQYHMNYPAIRERFVAGLFLNKHGSQGEISEKMELLKLPLPHVGFQVILIEIDDYEQLVATFSTRDLNLYKYALTNIAEELAAASFPSLVAEMDEHRFALLLNVEHNSEYVTDRHKDSIKALAVELQAQLKKLLHFSTSLGIGSVYRQVNQTHLSYKEALEVIGLKFIYGTGSILFHEELTQDKSSEYLFPVHIQSRYINYLRSGQIEPANEQLKLILLEILNKPNVGWETIYRLYVRLLDEILLYLQEVNAEPKAVFGVQISPYQELAKKETLMGIHEWMTCLTEQVIAYVVKQPRSNKYIEQVLEFIQTNYHLDLSLETIADQVDLNPAYLSRMCKQETGTTVVELLNKTRLEESKRLLLKTSRSIHEIAEQVGYQNANSFIRFFKRYEGITPGDYRKSQELN